MLILDLIILLAIAGMCGVVGTALERQTCTGFVVCVSAGFIGSVLGFAIASAAHLPAVFAWSVLGAAMFMAVIGYFNRRTVYVY